MIPSGRHLGREELGHVFRSRYMQLSQGQAHKARDFGEHFTTTGLNSEGKQVSRATKHQLEEEKPSVNS